MNGPITLADNSVITTNTPYGVLMSTFGLSKFNLYGQSVLTGTSPHGIAMSSSGQYITVVDSVNGGGYGKIYTSNNYGQTWILDISIPDYVNYSSVSISSSGQFQIAAEDTTNLNAGRVYYSYTYGNTWIPVININSNVDWKGTAISSSGQYITLVGSVQNTGTNNIYFSKNYGQTWFSTNISGITTINTVSISSSGKYQTICTTSAIYISNNYGINWTRPVTVVTGIISVYVCSSGQYQTMAVNNGRLYNSYDYGNTWNVNPNSTILTNNNWLNVASSSSGQYQVADVSGGSLYYSSDFGNSWNGPKTITTNTNNAISSIAISESGQYVAVIYNSVPGVYVSSVPQTFGTSLQVNNNLLLNYSSLTYNYNLTSTINYRDNNYYCSNIVMDKSGQFQFFSDLNQLYFSNNYGQTWSLSVEFFDQTITNTHITSIAMAPGNNTPYQYITVVFNKGGTIFYNLNSADSTKWVQSKIYVRGILTLNQRFISVSMSSDGKIQAAVTNDNQYVYISTDSGDTFNNLDPNTYSASNCISISSTGQYQTFTSQKLLYFSTDYGKTNTKSVINNSNNYIFYSVSVSSTGQIQTAVQNPGYIYISNDYGNTFNRIISPSQYWWYSVSVSSTGQYQTAVTPSTDPSQIGYIFLNFYISSDFGSTWSLLPINNIFNNLSDKNSTLLNFITISSTGQYISLSNRFYNNINRLFIYITPYPNNNLNLFNTSSFSLSATGPIGPSNGTNLYVNASILPTINSTFSLGFSGTNNSLIWNNVYTNYVIAKRAMFSPLFNQTSDYRIKDNVKQLDDTFSVKYLNPVTYTNNQTKQPDIGLIAHELQEYYPELVTGNKDGPEIQSINYTGLIPILINKIKSIKNRIEILEEDEDDEDEYEKHEKDEKDEKYEKRI
jgi:hypothetical protein